MKSEEEVQNAIERYADMVQKICVLHSKQQADAEDVFQNVFLKYATSKEFQDLEHEKAWLIRVTMNACNDRFRGWFHKQVDLSDTMDAYGNSSPDLHYLLDALKTLTDPYRNVLYLYYYEGYKITEIAEILHKKENTIHTWLRRAKTMLKDILGGDIDDFR